MTVETDTLILHAGKVCKHFSRPGDEQPLVVLDQIDLSLSAGDSVAIVGPSGCGKTTLLNILGTLDRATSGEIEIGGRDVTGLNDRDLAQVRATQIGFVFQEHHLLPQCSAMENVLLPTLARGVLRDGSEQQRAMMLLDRVGLADRAGYRPDALSGGQRQRVAIVRALINQPGLLLVDEPTGALDQASADGVMDLLIELNRHEQTAMVMVTHAENQAARLDCVLHLASGRLVSYV